MILSLKKIGQAVEELADENDDLRNFLISMFFTNGKRDLIKRKEKGNKIEGSIAFKINVDRLNEDIENAVHLLDDEKIENAYNDGFIILDKGGNVSYKYGEIRVKKDEYPEIRYLKTALKDLLDVNDEICNKLYGRINEETWKTVLENDLDEIKLYLKLDFEYDARTRLNEVAIRLSDKFFEKSNVKIICSICGEHGYKSSNGINEVLKFFNADKSGYLGTSFKRSGKENWLSGTFEVCSVCTKHLIVGWKYLNGQKINFDNNKILIIPNENNPAEYFKGFVERGYIKSNLPFEDLIFEHDKLMYFLNYVKEKHGFADVGFSLYITKENNNEIKILYVINSEINYIKKLNNLIRNFAEKIEKRSFNGYKNKVDKNLKGYVKTLGIIFGSSGKNKVVCPYGKINSFKLIEFILDKSKKDIAVPLQFYKNLVDVKLRMMKGKTAKNPPFGDILLYVNFQDIGKIMELILEEKGIGDFMKDSEWYEWAKNAGEVFRRAVEIQRKGGKYNERSSVPPLLRKLNKSLLNTNDIMRLLNESNKVVVKYSGVRGVVEKDIELFNKKMSWLSKVYSDLKTDPPKDGTKLTYNFLMGYYSYYSNTHEKEEVNENE